MLNKKISAMLLAIVFSMSICIFNTETKAKDEKKLDVVILLDNNSVNQEVKDIVTDNGGELLDEIPQIGEIHAKADSKLLLKLKDAEGVKTITSNTAVKFKNEETNYWKPSTDSYWKGDDANSNWREEGNSYWNAVSEDDKKPIVINDKQWDIKKVTNNGESYSIESGNHNVVVGIIDSGVDKDHKDLKQNLLGGENCVPANYLDDETETGDKDDFEDRYGHGTCVTGFIAANGKMKGVAPNIGYKAYRIFDNAGNTDFFVCADAITKAVDDKVNVINLSLTSFYLEGTHTYTDPYTGEVIDLGNNVDQYDVIKRAIDYAISHDVVVVTSAGNDAVDCSDASALADYFNNVDDEGYTYIGNIYEIPGSLEGVINVSASDINDNLADYSNFGHGFVDIAAPGGSDDKKCWTTSMYGKYCYGMGTSYATPKVTAAAALLLCKDSSLKPEEVEEKLYSSAKKIQNEQALSYFGSGIINVYDALTK